jgi:dTDP-4-dehydrorhamnose reductase
MRIAVIGRQGQVAQALLERGVAAGLRIVPVGRPETDLAQPDNLLATLQAATPDAIVNAAAYTAVDRAEAEPDVARKVNDGGAGAVAHAAAALRVPLVHLSTDYVFDGRMGRAYREDDITAPINVYGDSKLAGERSVAGAHADSTILRLSWIYSPFGQNFVRTMLRLGAGRDEIAVVADQLGSPTNALDIADGILAVTRNLLDRPHDLALRGIFHMAAGGDTNWAEFARQIFTHSAALGGPSARVRDIASSAYPTAAARPLNSRLDKSKLQNIHGVSLSPWPRSLPDCVRRLVASDFKKPLQ